MTIWRVAVKDLLLISRDRPALLFTLLVPLVVVTVVAETLSGSGVDSLRLPVVNEDEGPLAEVLIEALSEHMNVIEMEREKARAQVSRDASAAAALVIPEGATKRYLADRPTELTLWTDPAKGSELGVIKAYLLLAEREAASIADPFHEDLIVIEERNLTGSRTSTTSVEQNVPGFSIMFVLMAVLFGLAFSMRDEHEDRTWLRLQIAPVRGASLLAGKLLARWFVGWVQMLLLFGFGAVRYGLDFGPTWWLFPLMAAVIVFALSGFSLLVAALPRTREQIIPIGLTAVMLVCSIGGCWWPLFVQPPWLQQAAHLFPTAWAMDAISDLLLRERGLVELAPALSVLFAYGAACTVAGFGVHREPA